MPLPINSAVQAYLAGQGGLPRLELPGGRAIEAPNREWLLHQIRWRWLLDSLEGGEAYRQAWYGWDLRGMPVRNMIRHKREYPSSVDAEAMYSPQIGRPNGTDMAAQATDDDYELRRARTPVPTFVGEAIDVHVSKIYSQEIKREGPKPLTAWWEDVDGAGSTVDQWMARVAGPLFLLYGQLDLLFDHPARPDGVEINTRADELAHGLDTCVVSYVLPENIPWWKADRKGRYTELVMREVGDEGGVYFRYWNDAQWIKFDADGEIVDDGLHGFGRVPVVRCFDRRRPSCRMVGMSRYEAIAEIQREAYNRASELILSDTTQAHPLLQGPEDFVKADGTIPIGPNWLLPKKKNTNGGAATYEGFDVVQFPKDGAESIRRNLYDLRDAADRAACLTKPAGVAGTSAGTVGQSAAAKQIDQSGGHKLLGEIAASLEGFEQAVAEFACVVLGVKADPATTKVTYPRQFDLSDANELTDGLQGYQLALQQAGGTPEIEGEWLKAIVQQRLPGRDDKQYAAYDAEIDDFLTKAQADKAQMRESMLAAADPANQTDDTDPGEDAPGNPDPSESNG